MSLLTYKDAYPWAVSIKNEVLGLTMPPWFADERFGTFQHPLALTAREMNTVVDWCLGGSPEGDADGSESPAPPKRASSALGEPDQLLELPEPFVLEADLAEATYDVTFAGVRRGDRALRAIEFRPGSQNIVRSALVYALPEGATPEPGEIMASWVPGDGAEVFPEGHGAPLSADAALLLRIHYKKTWLDEGSEVEDQSSLALYFDEEPAGNGVRTLLVASRGHAEIESEARGFKTTAIERVPESVEIVSLLPRVEAHLDSLVAEALLPDGTVRRLIRLEGPDPDWPRTFQLDHPLVLPERSRIRLTLTASDEASLAAPHAFVLHVVPN